LNNEKYELIRKEEKERDAQQLVENLRYLRKKGIDYEVI